MGIQVITANYVNAHSPNTTRRNGGWSRPPKGFVKLNVDAHGLLRGTIGVVIRDDKGKFIVEGNWKIDWCADVLTAEALALRFDLLWHKRQAAIVS